MPQTEIMIEEARRILRVEAESLLAAADKLDQSFAAAATLMEESLREGGKLVLSGVGKSGNVAQKVAATLTSTGSTAIFLHPTEAMHGDLGVLGRRDTLVVFSNGGSSQELLHLLPEAKPLCRSTVAILGNPQGHISKHVNVVVPAVISVEACPHNLAPTTSSTLAMALGDAFALVLQNRLGFGPEHYAVLHPGGALGKRLRTRVSDLMHKEEAIALLAPEVPIDQVLLALTNFRHSGVCIVEGSTKSGKRKLVGVITEGDVRKALGKKEAFFKLTAKDIMTTKPTVVHAEEMATAALQIMEQRPYQLSFLPVVDQDGGCLGLIRIHDLVLAGIA
jgi:arabinose-5-phosphate isomerase